MALAAGLLSQLSRFLMKNGDSLAEEVHVSCVVSGIAAAAVWIRGAGGKHRPTHLLALSRLRRVLCNLYYYIYFFASVTFGNKNELEKKKAEPRFTSGAARPPRLEKQQNQRAVRENVRVASPQMCHSALSFGAHKKKTRKARPPCQSAAAFDARLMMK